KSNQLLHLRRKAATLNERANHVTTKAYEIS
ncbi:MAG: hypothetical protein ACI8VI_001001, partial [Granulosicoccus sp.]